jgi:hypothetical protein
LGRRKGQRQGWLASSRQREIGWLKLSKLKQGQGSLCLKLHRAKNVCNRVKAQQKNGVGVGRRQKKETNHVISLSQVLE